MFALAVLFDTIKVLPSQLDAHNHVIGAVTYNINEKYANRILPNVGLCVSHFDFVEISEGNIRHGDGCTYFKTTFRIVVFRPFIGEVLVGKVKSSDENGIRITLGFFDDIHVRWEGMPQPSAYDRSEASWFWVMDDDDGGGGEEAVIAEEKGGELTSSSLKTFHEDPFSSRKEARFYFFKDEQVRFVIEGDEFNEPEPPGPETFRSSSAAAGLKTSGQTSDGMTTEINAGKRIAPYKIKASMSGSGLGMISWWLDSEAQTPEEA